MPRPRAATDVVAKPVPRSIRVALVALLGAGAALLWGAGLDRVAATWGATPAEIDEPLPGDGLVAGGVRTTTRAVTVRAAPDEVWPWIAQLGQGRGGLYSYVWLEHALGIDIANLEVVDPALQSPRVGDRIGFVQEGYPAPLQYEVVEVVTGSHLVIAGPRGEPTVGSSSAYVVRPQADGTTRLLIRARSSSLGGFGDAVMKVVEPLAYAMERRQLESIALLAEGRPVPWTAEAAPALWLVSLGVTAAAAAGYALRRRESLPLLGVAVAGGGCLLWQLMVQPPFAVGAVVDAALVAALVAAARRTAGSGGRGQGEVRAGVAGREVREEVHEQRGQLLGRNGPAEVAVPQR